MTTSGFVDEYYEQTQAWGDATMSLREEERIHETLSLIPQGCSSILDAGCGDGRVVNRLGTRYATACGLDRSRAALKHVEVDGILGSIDCLPFPDRKFDLVLCCEVLEHLPFKVYPRALKEIERVAAKYIIVSVPDDEDIKRTFITCPHCGCFFHPNKHVRSFNPRTVTGLFSQFSLQSLKLCKPISKVYPGFVAQGVKLFRRMSSYPSTALCPQCGYAPSANNAATRPNTNIRDGLLICLLRPLARRLVTTRKQGGWLICLYQRKDN